MSKDEQNLCSFSQNPKMGQKWVPQTLENCIYDAHQSIIYITVYIYIYYKNIIHICPLSTMLNHVKPPFFMLYPCGFSHLWSPRNLRSGHGKGGLWKGCRQLKGHRHGSHLHGHASNARWHGSKPPSMVQNPWKIMGNYGGFLSHGGTPSSLDGLLKMENPG